MNIMQFALTLLNTKSYKINVIQVLKTDYIKSSLCVKKLIAAIFFFFFFFNCYLAVPRPALGHSQGGSLTNSMLITVLVHIRPEGHWEPRNKVGSLSPAERFHVSICFLLVMMEELFHDFR